MTTKLTWSLQGALLGVLGSPKRLQGTTRVSKMLRKAVPGRHPDTQTSRKSDQTSRHPDIQTSRQPRHPDIQTTRHPDMQTARHPDSQTSRDPDMRTPVHPDIQTTRHPDIQTPLTSHQSPLRGRRQGAKPLRYIYIYVRGSRVSGPPPSPPCHGMV